MSSISVVIFAVGVYLHRTFNINANLIQITHAHAQKSRYMSLLFSIFWISFCIRFRADRPIVIHRHKYSTFYEFVNTPKYQYP